MKSTINDEEMCASAIMAQQLKIIIVSMILLLCLLIPEMIRIFHNGLFPASICTSSFTRLNPDGYILSMLNNSANSFCLSQFADQQGRYINNVVYNSGMILTSDLIYIHVHIASNLTDDNSVRIVNHLEHELMQYFNLQAAQIKIHITFRRLRLDASSDLMDNVLRESFSDLDEERAINIILTESSLPRLVVSNTIIMPLNIQGFCITNLARDMAHQVRKLLLGFNDDDSNELLSCLEFEALSQRTLFTALELSIFEHSRAAHLALQIARDYDAFCKLSHINENLIINQHIISKVRIIEQIMNGIVKACRHSNSDCNLDQCITEYVINSLGIVPGTIASVRNEFKILLNIAEAIDLQTFPLDQLMAIFAPFWVPLLVPLSKGISVIWNR